MLVMWPGYAFASGYREALRQLCPGLDDVRAALCASEAGGAHPRAIATRLEPDGSGFRLSGRKPWVTLGTHAQVLLVVASQGEDAAGRNRLVLVRVPADREGVSVLQLPAAPFIPEVPHASLLLTQVWVAPGEYLPGDGYERYLKPFRTIEDLHVHAALLAWLLQVARRAGWPRALQQEALLLLVAAHALACVPRGQDPKAADSSHPLDLAALQEEVGDTTDGLPMLGAPGSICEKTVPVPERPS